MALPTELLIISSNMSNLAGVIFPLIMIYLNSKLPYPARSKWWSTLALVLFATFSGFFFLNFLAVQLTGTALITF
jgi:hypothetical protein